MVKIFVGNLDSKTKSEDIKRKFEKYGDVRECDIVNNYAFVHMDNETDAKEAIKQLHNAELDGVKINVEMSHGRKERRGGGGGGPMRRRNDRGAPPRGREYDRNGPPRGYGGPGYPRDRYDGPGWDGPYGPPMRSMDRGYGYPDDRYGDPRREPRGPFGRDMPPESAYRGPPRDPIPGRDMPSRDPVGREPMPPRDYRPSDPSRRYDNYDSYPNGYDRPRDPALSSAPRSGDYYDNYNSSYGSAPSVPSNYDYPDYRDSRSNAAPAPPSYESSYDYGSYYDRAQPPSRAPYNYSR